MKRRIAWCLGLLMAPQCVGAAELGMSGTTLLRIEQRQSPGFSKERLVPATQFIGFDAAGLADGNLSFHFYGWGRQDLADKSFNDNGTEGDFSYGYLKYRFAKANADLRGGRFFVSEGIAREQVDGVAARADLLHGFNASFFGGSPARQKNDNSGNHIEGGRISYRRPGWLEVGAAVVNQGGTDSQRYTRGGIPPFSTAGDRRTLVGGDIWLAPTGNVELTGRSSYNTVTSSLAEHNYLLQVTPLKGVSIAGFYLKRNFEGYFSGTNVPALFKPDTLDDSWQAGAGVGYAVSEPLEISADYRHISRRSLGDTERFGGEARMAFKGIPLRAGLGYHRNSAPKIPTTTYDLSYNELHGWVFYDKGRYLASLDVTANLYDDRNNPYLNGVSNDLEAVASAGYRVFPNLTVSGDLTCGYNALLRNEWKGLIRVEFALNSAGKEVQK